MIELHPVESSSVSHAGYDPDRQVLAVKWKSSGKTSYYSRVPAEKHAALHAAPSIGKYIHTQIKPFHPHSYAEPAA